jgi:hypothetical protein
VRVATIDGSRLRCEDDFWQEYLMAFQPEGSMYFGRNIAAFREAVVAGGPGWPGKRCRLVIANHMAAWVGPCFFDQLAEIAAEAPGFELVLA